MTPTEWAIFIVFNISINIILQTLAWKIAFKIGENRKTSASGGQETMTPEEAIKIIKHEMENDIFISDYRNKVHEAEDMAIKALEKRPHGEWTIIRSPMSNETVVKCPFCKDEFIGNDVEDYNFCPICGAEMHQEEKDT